MNDYYETYEDPRAQRDHAWTENARLKKRVNQLESEVERLKILLNKVNLKAPVSQ